MRYEDTEWACEVIPCTLGTGEERWYTLRIKVGGFYERSQVLCKDGVWRSRDSLPEDLGLWIYEHKEEAVQLLQEKLIDEVYPHHIVEAT